MALYGYHFIREVEKFNLDSYIAHLGWVAMGITTIKIYSKFDSSLFYLHDEVLDRLFEFTAEEPKKLKSAEEYNRVVEAFFMTYS